MFTRNIVPHVDAGFRCHAIDLLGHGYTDKPDFDYEIPRDVEHVLGYLDAEVASTVCTLQGNRSAGGSRPGSPAKHPERVHTLQLIAAGGTRANPEIMERIRTSTLRAVELDDPARDAGSGDYILSTRRSTMGSLLPSSTGASFALAAILEKGGNIGVLVDQKFSSGLENDILRPPMPEQPGPGHPGTAL